VDALGETATSEDGVALPAFESDYFGGSQQNPNSRFRLWNRY
jgi:hypothetical protein